MRQGRVSEIIKETDECIARAESFIGTENAEPEELAAIARLREMQATGSAGDVVLALAVVGRLQRSPSGFWREVRRAAHLTGVTLPKNDNR
jgi:hypothetical protein